MATTDYSEETTSAMARIRSRMNEDVSLIRADKRLTSAGRRAEMAKVVLRAQEQANQLKADHVADREARRRSLQRSLFGQPAAASPTDVVVWRDALDRADKLQSEEDGAALLKRARQGGDESLARAVAQRASNAGWQGVLGEFINHDDDPGAMTANYVEPQSLASIPAGRNTDLADVVAFSIRTPDELRSITTDNDLQRLANGDELQRFGNDDHNGGGFRPQELAR